MQDESAGAPATSKVGRPVLRRPTLDVIFDEDGVERLPPPPRPLRIVPKRDALDVVREAVGELEYLATVWQAAGVCGAAIAKALGASAVLVRLHDRKHNELRTIAVEPKRAHELLGTNDKTDDDFVAFAVVATGKPMTVSFDGELSHPVPERLKSIGAARSLVAVPAMTSDACVAVIEVIDASEALAGHVVEACSFVADQLASFIVRREQ